ncbi:MAG: RhuM family protein [Terriglobales bacterium]
MAPDAPIGEIVLYQTDDGRTRVECRFAEESIWLTQALIAELYGKDVRTVNEHLLNLFEDGELDPSATVRKFRIVRTEGAREVVREIEHYSLDAILAVGYRVRSARGAQFRRWATERLREYLLKGFVLDDERLKNPPVAGSGVPDYFDELLERIRDIRASERRMYLRVREIFALAADYEPAQAETARFFQTMQNKLHFAATGRHQRRPRPVSRTGAGAQVEVAAATVESGHNKPYVKLLSVSARRGGLSAKIEIDTAGAQGVLRRAVWRAFSPGPGAWRRLPPGDFYAQELFQSKELVGYLKSMAASRRGVYEDVVYESEVERKFAEELDRNEAVRLYAKLPKWFWVATPLGDYNPDWAVLIARDGAERLYLVVETKGSALLRDLRETEAAKIRCGKAHFAALASGQDNPAQFRLAKDLATLLAEV